MKKNTTIRTVNNTINPLPIGRLDYLNSHGYVRESFEYTSSSLFIQHIIKESEYGAPMVIILYKDKDENTISLDFTDNLGSVPAGFKIIENPHLDPVQKKPIRQKENECGYYGDDYYPVFTTEMMETKKRYEEKLRQEDEIANSLENMLSKRLDDLCKERKMDVQNKISVWIQPVSFLKNIFIRKFSRSNG